MDQDQKSNMMIALGLILILLDWTLLSWFPSLITTFLGICLLCNGISSKNRAKTKGQNNWNYSRSPRYRQRSDQPHREGRNNETQKVIETSYEEEVTPSQPRDRHRFCPMCGARARGKYCPECGSKID